MKEVFDRFVDALEKNQVELLESVLDDNVVLNSSALGCVDGKEKVIEAFRWKGLKTDLYKAKIFDNVVRKCGNKVWQTFYSVLLIGKYGMDFMNLFQCCFINAFEYVDNKIVSIKSNMTFEHGNTLMVSEWWNMIDYKTEYGCKRGVVLDGAKDNPWLNCPVSEIPLNDAEEIQDTFNRYCLDLDLGNFDDLANVAAENMGPYTGSEGGRDVWISNFKKQWARKVVFNGEEFVREAVWNHINTFQSLDIQGDKAYAVIYRFEPNRIGTRFQHKYNLNSHYYSFIWYMHFKKENGKWLMDGIDFSHANERGPWQVEYDMDQRYF